MLPKMMEFKLEDAKHRVDAFFLTEMALQPGVERVMVCGSIRRKAPIVHDVDIIVTGDREKILNLLPEIRQHSKFTEADQKIEKTIRFIGGMQFDIVYVPRALFNGAMQHYTGSKGENIRLASIAISKGLKLNEYGLRNRVSGEFFGIQTEEEIYKSLGQPFRQPEER